MDLVKALHEIRDAAERRSDFLSKELALTGLGAVEGADGSRLEGGRARKVGLGAVGATIRASTAN